ncbi:MAG: hypothetical protein OSJ69_20075, partial [Acetatifactor sp.]|nr:hypothetical protein [Acetatifactor sp.]
MQNKKKRRSNSDSRCRSVRFEELLDDDRFDDEDYDTVTEDTLEFLSLDDDMIASYQKAHSAARRNPAPAVKSRGSRYEDEDYEEDEEYEDEDY